MAQWKDEILIGAVDGLNSTFFTTGAYLAGSTLVRLNGVAIRHPDGDPWTEVDPLTGEISIDPLCAPRPGDVLSVEYLDGTGELPLLRELSGALSVADRVQGKVEGFSVKGSLLATQNISSRVSVRTKLKAKMSLSVPIRAILGCR